MPLTPYSFVTLATASQELANRLFDSTGQFWTSAERTIYIQEALRTWNALTGFWRDDFTFATQQAIQFYDLANGSLPNTIRPYTVTDAQLILEMQYHLLEPPNVTYPLVWGGSLQFTFDDLIQAIARRRDEVLGVTGCTMTHRVVPAVPGRIVLPDLVIDLRRVGFLYFGNALPGIGFGQGGFGQGPFGGTPAQPGLGLASTMFQDDVWSLQAFENSWTQNPAGIPLSWRVSSEPPIAFEVDTPPLAPSSYDLLTIEANAALLTTAATLLTVPDDWTWVIKWGALADLLGRESNSKDLLRAKYAEGRYRQGLALLTSAPALLALRIANAPLQVDGVQAADNYRSSWQAELQGQPTVGLTAGLNLLALAPTPDAGPYSVTCTVIENAPIPVNPGDLIQVGRDLYDTILDYAQHLASFKMGGEEFMATQPLLDHFMQEAALYSSRFNEQGEFTRTMRQIAQREADLNPRYEADMAPEAGAD